MPKTTFINGTPVTPTWLNAMQEHVHDGVDADGSAPKIKSANIEDAGSPLNILPNALGEFQLSEYGVPSYTTQAGSGGGGAYLLGDRFGMPGWSIGTVGGVTDLDVQHNPADDYSVKLIGTSPGGSLQLGLRSDAFNIDDVFSREATFRRIFSMLLSIKNNSSSVNVRPYLTVRSIQGIQGLASIENIETVQPGEQKHFVGLYDYLNVNPVGDITAFEFGVTLEGAGSFEIDFGGMGVIMGEVKMDVDDASVLRANALNVASPGSQIPGVVTSEEAGRASLTTVQYVTGAGSNTGNVDFWIPFKNVFKAPPALAEATLIELNSQGAPVGSFINDQSSGAVLTIEEINKTGMRVKVAQLNIFSEDHIRSVVDYHVSENA